jgi:WD40 repeat protein
MSFPFKFLDSYTYEDHDIFFGREKEIEELYHKVFESRLLLVYGNSGTGKSSLINCGLAGKFEDPDWLPLNIRRGSDIVQSIEYTLQKVAITPISPANPLPLSFLKSVRSIYLDYFKPIFFIFDQFEELFIFGSPEEKKSFIEIIKVLNDSDLQCRFIFILREEYLAGTTEFERYIPTFLSNRLRIERISLANAKQAIEGPCKIYGIQLEEGFSETLLEKLSPGASEIELTYLQVFLDKIYGLALHESEEGDGPHKPLVFTNSLFDKVGNVADLLRDFLDKQITHLNDPESAIIVLKSFVSAKGTKLQIGIEEIMEYTTMLGKPLSKEIVKELLQSFVQIRILTDKDHNGRYELRHDALASKIYEKISFVEKELIEIQSFIYTSFDNYQRRNILLSSEDLNYIFPYEERLFLKRPLKEFIDKSKKNVLKSKRRKYLIAAIVVFTVFILLSCLSIWALVERNTARKTARISHSNELATLSLLNLSKDPTLSFRLAEKSYNEFNGRLSQEATSLAYESAAYFPFYVALEGHHDRVYSFDYTQLNNGRIVTASFDSTARIWDMNGKQLSVLKGHKNRLFSANISSNGKYILTSSYDSTIRIWDINGRSILIIKDSTERNYLAKFSPNSEYIVSGATSGLGTIWHFDQTKLVVNKICYLHGHKAALNFIDFSNDNKYIITTSEDHTGIIWNYEGKRIAILKGHRDRVRHADFSPDNSRIITSSDDATARIWDLHGKNLKVLNGHTGGVTRSMYSPDGEFVITVSNDGTLMIWSADGVLQKTWKCNAGSINRCDISSDSKIIAIGTSTGISQIIDRQGNLLYELRRHDHSIWDIRFIHRTNKVITSSIDGLVKIWNLCPTDMTLKCSQIKKVICYEPLISKNILIGLAQNDDLAIFDLINNSIKEFVYNSSDLHAKISSDGKYILTSSEDKTARLWTADGTQIMKYQHSHEVSSAIFSPDGKTILTASSSGANLWDLTGELLNEYQYDIEPINYADFSPDGKTILVSSSNKQLLLWNLDGDLLNILKGHQSEIQLAKYSPDGNYILSGSSDGIGILWNKNGTIISKLAGHRTALVDLGFSQDGKYSYTLSQNPCLIQIWNMRGKLLNIINLGESKEHFASFSGDSLLVFTSINNHLYIRNWPIHFKDILTRANQELTIGKFRQLSNKEMAEYDLKF